MQKNGFLKWYAVSCLAVIVFALSRCGNPGQQQDNRREDSSPGKLAYLNHNDTVGYVGIETCRQCHVAIHSTFIHTGMGLSFGVADTAKSIARIGKDAMLKDEYHNLYYHPFWQGDSLQLSEFRLKGRDTSYLQTITIDYVVGSGQHTNSHMVQRNGYLYQAPFTWYSQKGKLDLPPGYENGQNVRFERPIGLECTSCHNSMPIGFVKGSVNKYRKVPGAIDCERCHGPGELHVKKMMRGDFTDTSKAIDYSIVNLKKLSVDLQFETCQRCHLQGNSVVAEGKTFFDFKPGMKLNSVMDIYLPRYSNSEDDFIMASHVDRFKQSKCYIHSTDQFNCVTCHNPHVSVRETKLEKVNHTCKKCHEGKAPKFECTEALATLQKADFNCVNCHMPKSTSTDIPHVTVHDHKIKIPRKRADTSGIKKFLELVAVNNPEPTVRSKALAYLQQYERFEPREYYLDSAQYFLNRLNDKKGYVSLWIHYYFLRGDYQGLVSFVNDLSPEELLKNLDQLSYDNSDAWTAYRIGEAYLRSGNDRKAISFLEKAVRLAPYYPGFRNKLGNAYLNAGKREEGKRQFQAVVKEQPYQKEALNNLGYLYMEDGNLEEALRYFKKALAEDPDYEKAWLNMTRLYMQTENYKAAKNAVEEALRINPMNNRARQVLTFLKETI